MYTHLQGCAHAMSRSRVHTRLPSWGIIPGRISNSSISALTYLVTYCFDSNINFNTSNFSPRPLDRFSCRIRSLPSIVLSASGRLYHALHGMVGHVNTINQAIKPQCFAKNQMHPTLCTVRFPLTKKILM